MSGHPNVLYFPPLSQSHLSHLSSSVFAGRNFNQLYIHKLNLPPTIIFNKIKTRMILTPHECKAKDETYIHTQNKHFMLMHIFVFYINCHISEEAYDICLFKNDLLH